MTDPYFPTLASFSFTKKEREAIVAALLKDKPWKETSAGIKSAKAKIREFHLERRNKTCCYCCTNLAGGGDFMIDREHVLPKGKFKPFTFEIWNLSVACKRCNMEMKRESQTFVVDWSATAPFQSGANYRFVHPNFDDWEEHLYRTTSQVNMKTIVRISVVGDSVKGRFTHDFFKLKDLETGTYDNIQNAARIDFMDLMEGALEARELARTKGQ